MTTTVSEKEWFGIVLALTAALMFVAGIVLVVS